MPPENQNDGQPADTSNEGSTAPEGNSPEGDNTTPPETTLLAGKYKSVEDLEKGYRESTKYSRDLSTKVKDLESAVPTAPEAYEFDFSGVEGLEEYTLPNDDPEVMTMLPIFKDLNLTNEQANTLVQAHLKNQISLAETPEQLKAGLGSNADVILTKLQEFTNTLPIEDQQIVSALSDTAAGTEFLYRHLVGGELPTPGPVGDGGAAPASAAEMFKTAFDYKKDNNKSIGFNVGEQAQYKKLMHAALTAEQNEKKAKN